MFTINNENWLIKFIPPTDRIFRVKDGSYTVGACDDIMKTIYLANNLTGDFLYKVLCHEIVHAAMFSYNVDLTHEQEELLANIIATYGEEIIKITNDMFKRLRH